MPIKAREVREQLHGKCEPQVLRVLETLAEDHSIFQQQLDMMAQMQDGLTDIVANFNVIAGNMHNVVETMGMKASDRAKAIKGTDSE